MRLLDDERMVLSRKIVLVHELSVWRRRAATPEGLPGWETCMQVDLHEDGAPASQEHHYRQELNPYLMEEQGYEGRDDYMRRMERDLTMSLFARLLKLRGGT